MALLFLQNLKFRRGHLGRRAIVCVLLQLPTKYFLGVVAAAAAAEAPLNVYLLSFVQPSAHIWLSRIFVKLKNVSQRAKVADCLARWASCSRSSRRFLVQLPSLAFVFFQTRTAWQHMNAAALLTDFAEGACLHVSV